MTFVSSAIHLSQIDSQPDIISKLFAHDFLLRRDRRPRLVSVFNSLKTCLTFDIAVVAGAAPFVPIRVPTLDFKNPGHDNDSTTPYVPIGWGVTLTCEGIQTKNQESWKSSGVGDWFVKMYVISDLHPVN